MHTITSKSGKTILVRSPQESDVQIMLDYINAIGMEDIYVNANPNDLYTFKHEDVFVKTLIKKISTNQQLYYLAFHNQDLIGSVSIEKGSKRSRHLGTFGITLSKEYRSDGIGFKLSQYAIKKAQKKLNIQLITLSSFEKNTPAINMYKKLGFVKYSHLPKGFVYKDGYENEVMMYKSLVKNSKKN